MRVPDGTPFRSLAQSATEAKYPWSPGKSIFSIPVETFFPESSSCLSLVRLTAPDCETCFPPPRLRRCCAPLSTLGALLRPDGQSLSNHSSASELAAGCGFSRPDHNHWRPESSEGDATESQDRQTISQHFQQPPQHIGPRSLTIASGGPCPGRPTPPGLRATGLRGPAAARLWEPKSLTLPEVRRPAACSSPPQGSGHVRIAPESHRDRPGSSFLNHYP